MKIISTLLMGAAIAALSIAATPKPKPHPTSTSRLVMVRMDIDFKPHKRSSFGRISGYDPAEVHVHMGDRIQFVNPDDQNHTATGMAYTGDYFYACGYHIGIGQIGVIVVEP